MSPLFPHSIPNEHVDLQGGRDRPCLVRALTLSDAALLDECAVDVFFGSGPGGQHRNKTESAVRLRHALSGIVVCATERRSQLQNKRIALKRLRQKLLALLHIPKERRPTQPTRASVQKRLAQKKILSEKKKARQGHSAL